MAGSAPGQRLNENGQLSQKLTNFLVNLTEDDIHLVALCVTELNDREENKNHFPIIYGIAVNMKTAEICRASFQEWVWRRSCELHQL